MRPIFSLYLSLLIMIIDLEVNRAFTQLHTLAEYQQVLRVIQSENEQMTTIINSPLLLARADTESKIHPHKHLAKRKRQERAWASPSSRESSRRMAEKSCSQAKWAQARYSKYAFLFTKTDHSSFLITHRYPNNVDVYVKTRT